MKLCFACGKQAQTTLGNKNLCFSCSIKLKTNFLVKCITCGTWGFVPITTKSIFYFSEGNVRDNIAMLNYCPTCSKEIKTCSDAMF